MVEQDAIHVNKNLQIVNKTFHFQIKLKKTMGPTIKFVMHEHDSDLQNEMLINNH